MFDGFFVDRVPVLHLRIAEVESYMPPDTQDLVDNVIPVPTIVVDPASALLYQIKRINATIHFYTSNGQGLTGLFADRPISEALIAD